MIYTNSPELGKIEPAINPFPLSFDFNDGAQGWEFTTPNGAAGQAANGRLEMWSPSGWRNAFWRYHYPVGLIARTGAKVTYQNIYCPANDFMHVRIRFTDGRVIENEKWSWPGENGTPLDLMISSTDNGRMVDYIEWSGDSIYSSGVNWMDNVTLTGFDISH